MSDQWMDRLSEYADGELEVAEVAQLEAHLRDCADCRAVLDDLRAVVARAGALEDREPATDLWPNIAERIQGRADITPITSGRRQRRRIAFTLPQLAAAGLAVTLLGSGAVWAALQRGDEPSSAVVVPVTAPAVPEASAAETYGTAIADLEAALRDPRTSLDTATVRVLEESLRAIDRAIAEAQTALDEDPASRYLQDHLSFTMRRKLELLNQAATLVTASS